MLRPIVLFVVLLFPLVSLAGNGSPTLPAQRATPSPNEAGSPADAPTLPQSHHTGRMEQYISPRVMQPPEALRPRLPPEAEQPRQAARKSPYLSEPPAKGPTTKPDAPAMERWKHKMQRLTAWVDIILQFDNLQRKEQSFSLNKTLQKVWDGDKVKTGLLILLIAFILLVIGVIMLPVSLVTLDLEGLGDALVLVLLGVLLLLFGIGYTIYGMFT